MLREHDPNVEVPPERPGHDAGSEVTVPLDGSGRGLAFDGGGATLMAVTTRRATLLASAS